MFAQGLLNRRNGGDGRKMEEDEDDEAVEEEDHTHRDGIFREGAFTAI